MFQLFGSDKLALRAMGAREVTPAEAPELHAMIDRLCVQAVHDHSVVVYGARYELEAEGAGAFVLGHVRGVLDRDARCAPHAEYSQE